MKIFEEICPLASLKGLYYYFYAKIFLKSLQENFEVTCQRTFVYHLLVNVTVAFMHFCHLNIAVLLKGHRALNGIKDS